MNLHLSMPSFGGTDAIREYVEWRLLPLAYDYPTGLTIDLSLDDGQESDGPRFLVRGRLRFQNGEAENACRCERWHEGVDRTVSELATSLRRARLKVNPLRRPRV